MGDRTSAPQRAAHERRPQGQGHDQDRTERIAQARIQIARALAVEGYVSDSLAVCPQCHGTGKGKNKVFDDGGFTCHRCGFYTHNAVDFLTRPRVRQGGQIIGQATEVTGDTVKLRSRGEETVVKASEVTLEGGKWRFGDAVEVLLGADLPHPEGKPPATGKIAVAKSFVADENWELYEHVVSLGSLEAAQEFFSRWHIDPDVVARFRSVRITMSDTALMKALRERWTPEQVVSSGLATPSGFMLLDHRYPVIEPHLTPDGRVAGMQFRASEETERKVAAHKQFSARRKAAEDAKAPFDEPEVPYVPKFMSLAGATQAMAPGIGVANLAALVAAGDPAKLRRVYVVEGFKDVLAGETMGMTCYGVPGAGKVPVRGVCQLLARFDQVFVTLDGDEAGAEGRKRLLAHLESHGINAVEKTPPEGKDIAFSLVGS